MKAAWRAGLLMACIGALPAAAVELAAPPGSHETTRRSDPAGPFGIAIGPAAPFATPPERSAPGRRLRIAWRGTGDADDLLDDLQAQLSRQGFTPLFQCATESCGGFDFRSAQPVLPMPYMFVDLGAFTYLAFQRPATEDRPEALAALIASPGAEGGFAQLTLIAPDEDTQAAAPDAPVADAAPETAPVSPIPATDFAARMAQNGHVALDGMRFDTGADDMDTASVPALQALAAFLKADTTRRVALVGHSDWTGSDEANRRVSRARAAAVAKVLTGQLGVASAQISIHGAGYLAPRTSNATDAGRTANRRVEAVLLPPAP